MSEPVVNEDPVLKELLAENEGLREKLAIQGNISYAFQIMSLSKPIRISGVLIAEGVWKGIKYSYEQMKASLSKFIGIPVRIDHGHTKEFGLTEVGKVDKVIPNDMLRSLLFEAEVTDEKAQQLVETKVLDSVSIKGEFGNVDTKLFPPLGMNYTPEEMSLTSSPSCDFCQIFSVELTKCLNESEVLSKAKGEVMPEEVYVSKEDILVETDIEEGKEGQFELMREADYLVLRKGKLGYKVVPGYYPSKIRAARKVGGEVQPKYPHYQYEKYGAPKKLSEIEMLDALDLAEDYKTFMKDCIASGKDVKTCAVEYKAKTSPATEVPQAPLSAEPALNVEPEKPKIMEVPITEVPKVAETPKVEPVPVVEASKVEVPAVEVPKVLEVPKVVETPKEEPPEAYKFEVTPQSVADLILGRLPPEKKV